MKARLHAVQRALWALVFVSAALAILAFPRGNNAAYTAALAELQAFDKGFKRPALERSLLAYAQAQGIIALADVARLITGPRVPSVQAAAKARPLVPLAQLELRTLGEVQDRARTGSSLPIGAPAAEPLAAAVAWRLARSAASPSFTLTAIALRPARLSDSDLEREREVARLRLATHEAELAKAEASKQLTTAEETFDARRKRRLPWKILVKFDEARKAARAAVSQRQHALGELAARYEALAKQAEASAANPAAVSGKHALPSKYALAAVTLEAAPAGPITLQVPVALAIRTVSLPTLAGTEFAATRSAGLWDEVKDDTADAAVRHVLEKFTWHHRTFQLAGLQVRGMTVLHTVPMLLPFLLFGVLQLIRRVTVSYNPFGAGVDVDLPKVGLGSRATELVALVILPLVAVVLTASALWAVSQLPIVPILVGLSSLGLGVYAFIELGALQNLIEAVVHSHSIPPESPAQPGSSPS